MEFIRRGFIDCARSAFRCRYKRSIPNCRMGGIGRSRRPPPAGVSRFGCALLVGAQLVWLVGEGIDECVGGGLDSCRLRIVGVVLGVHGQVFFDRIVD